MSGRLQTAPELWPLVVSHLTPQPPQLLVVLTTVSQPSSAAGAAG